jgi:hypothetical protein
MLNGRGWGPGNHLAQSIETVVAFPASGESAFRSNRKVGAAVVLSRLAIRRKRFQATVIAAFRPALRLGRPSDDGSDCCKIPSFITKPTGGSFPPAKAGWERYQISLEKQQVVGGGA